MISTGGCICSLHWSLAIIINPRAAAEDWDDDDGDAPMTCIALLDPLGNYHNKATLLKQLRCFLGLEWEKCGAGKATNEEYDQDKVHALYVKAPQQQNSFDCGVFILKYAEVILKNYLTLKDGDEDTDDPTMPISREVTDNKLELLIPSEAFDASDVDAKRRQVLEHIEQDTRRYDACPPIRIHVLNSSNGAVQASLVTLTEANFDAETKESVWLVKFYAPWCGHCKKLAPLFEQLPDEAEIKTANVRIGKVDCTTERSICERFSVQSYPTIKVISEGRFYDYAGRREVADFVKFVTAGYKSEYSEQVLSLAEFVAQRDAAAAEQADAEKHSSVVTLTSASFEELVKDSKGSWIIKFYAPWCGHCKRLTPTWHRLSRSLQEGGSQTKVAKVDCTVHRRVCSRFGVNGYPTLFYVNDGNVYKYQGARSLNAFLEYVNGGWKSAELVGPIPDETLLSTIVDSAVEWAAEHTVMAILVGILIIAVFVAILVALLDYCLAEDDIEKYRELPRPAEATKANERPAPAANKPKAE
ncbi:TPA: hypothetical protein N0F65_001509 [Lagenidium giganteum]|uniref:Protein disulfide isomerase n=1 Tax=Lagenidium giganteum TaxID=4803 RepID=A0AAV2Z4L7_9STRA|nr:TPA: hypothetical protein N0F65_001509 [Lagenidium giganteum]